MKNLRKWIALAAAMAMTATLLTGCGSSEAPASEAAASTADSSTAVATAPAETTAADGELAADVQAIVDRGVLRVGVKNAVVGFGFQDTLTGEYSGLEISLAEKIAESLGVDVEFTAVTAATRTELLDSGDIDCVLATFTITDERKQSWDFSTPYFTDYVTVLVEDKSGISSLADLVDKKVGVSSGSTSAKALVKAMIDAGLIDGSGFDADTFDPALWTTGISFQQCSPSGYSIYLFTIVLYRSSVKRLLSECPGEFIKRFSTPATLRFPNRAHRYPLQRQ